MLTGLDKDLLSHLAKHNNGLHVKNSYVELFGAYEGAGLVTLSTCMQGPLRLPDQGYFWAKITSKGVEALNQDRRKLMEQQSSTVVAAGEN